MTININIEGTDVFQEVLSVIKEFMNDERVPIEAKQDFKEKYYQ